MLYHMFQNDFAMFLSRRYTLPQTMNVECGIKLNWIKREKGLVFILLRTGTVSKMNYRSGTVNSKSFVGKVLLRIKWKFKLN